MFEKLEYKSLKLKLLKFSQYKICEKEVNSLKCKEVIKSIQKLRKDNNEKKSYISILIISDDKIIDTIDSRLDSFNLNFFKKYSKAQKDIKIVVYFFDMKDKFTKNKYHSFLEENSFYTYKERAKNAYSVFKLYFSPILILLGLFVLFFTYLGVAEYGIPSDYITDIASIAFLMISASAITIGALILLMSVVTFFFIPFFFYAIFEFNGLWSFLIILVIYIILFYGFFKNAYPLKTKFIHQFMLQLNLILIAGFTIVLILGSGFIMTKSILSTFFENNKYYDKSGYGLVINEYFNHCTGFPKILKKEDKYYYLPIKDSKRYYVYDIDDVKDRYNTLLKNNTEGSYGQICKNDEMKNKFYKNYILNNPYIKPAYLKEQFKIDNKEIKVEDFNMSKIITFSEINNLCNDLNISKHKKKNL